MQLMQEDSTLVYHFTYIYFWCKKIYVSVSAGSLAESILKAKCLPQNQTYQHEKNLLMAC